MAVIWTEASPDLIHMAADLVKQHHPDLSEAIIGFVFRSEPSVSGDKLVLGQASKLPSKLTPYLDYHFIIWISLPTWHEFSPEKRQALVDHELCHCTMTDEGEPKLRSHDVQEFTAIIERYGIWKSDLAPFAWAIQKSPQMQLAIQFEEAAAIPGRIEAIKTSLAESLVDPS